MERRRLRFRHWSNVRDDTMTISEQLKLAAPPVLRTRIWAILLGLAAAVSLNFLPAEIRGRVLPPFQDLFFEPAVVAQGVFLATLIMLMGEWTSFRRRRAEVAELQVGDDKEESANES